MRRRLEIRKEAAEDAASAASRNKQAPAGGLRFALWTSSSCLVRSRVTPAFRPERTVLWWLLLPCVSAAVKDDAVASSVRDPQWRHATGVQNGVQIETKSQHPRNTESLC
jgi:hypothetical protein